MLNTFKVLVKATSLGIPSIVNAAEHGADQVPGGGGPQERRREGDKQEDLLEPEPHPGPDPV